ncbi:Holliday junction branch migration protein RuvA [Bacillus kexueae]|uniref:Holliday junction branch migration protein RuvA n=1 Tax=Aeribacillus kexueae TaxID=2078952 RepID=UPI001FAFFCC7
MIEFVKGTVRYISPEFVVVENGGIGYQIVTPNPFVYQKYMNQQVTVYTYQYVREDLIALYGFETREEKALFIKLLNVTGIGPKGGLAILASGDPGQVVEAIENEDEKFLVKFPGVGKKTARQIILDLKGKLVDIIPAAVSTDLFNYEEVEEKKQSEDALSEAIEALKVLGYSEREINKVIPSLKGVSLSTDQYVKMALQKLLK